MAVPVVAQHLRGVGERGEVQQPLAQLQHRAELAEQHADRQHRPGVTGASRGSSPYSSTARPASTQAAGSCASPAPSIRGSSPGTSSHAEPVGQAGRRAR